MRPLLLLPLALAAPLACNDTDFERQSELARVRVLAVRTEPAELVLDPAAPATLPPPLTLEALAVAPAGRAVSVTYALCRPGDVFAAGFECPGRDGVALAGNQLSLADPAVQEVLAALAGGAPGAALDVSAPGVRARLEAGVPLLVGYLASDGSDAPEGRERGVRQLTLRLTAAPNRNPVVEEVLVDGAPVAGPLGAGQEVVLSPRLAPGSLERFETPGEGVRTEAVFYSWHATGEGEVRQFRSLEPVDGEPGDPTVEYVVPAEPGPVTLYVVARDGRGGVGWLVREVPVGP